MSFSQNDEESWIARLLERGTSSKRFLDIGAHDGVTFSNTRALALKGWGGTLVEPSPAAFTQLMRAYENNKDDVKLAHVALVAQGPRRMLKFYDSHGDMVSTVSESHRELWSGKQGHLSVNHKPEKVRFQPIYVAAMSVTDLLSEFPGPYDFVNLDVEGTNFEIFRELPLRDLNVRVICVEYQDKRVEITEHALAQGYALMHTNPENLIFATSM